MSAGAWFVGCGSPAEELCASVCVVWVWSLGPVGGWRASQQGPETGHLIASAYRPGQEGIRQAGRQTAALVSAMAWVARSSVLLSGRSSDRDALGLTVGYQRTTQPKGL